MADAINTDGIRPVTLPNQLPPMPVVARILARFDRDQLHGFIAVAIDLADSLDGDPDVELNGDERGDQAWNEWTTMRASDKRGPNKLAAQEDDEDDDPAGQYDEDCYSSTVPKYRSAGCPISDPGGCEHDGREEEESALTPEWRIDQRETVPDRVVVENDRAATARHRDRIRRTRCVEMTGYRRGEFRLKAREGLMLSDPEGVS